MNKKTTRILVAVLAVLAVAVGVLFAVTRPETSAGSKTITPAASSNRHTLFSEDDWARITGTDIADGYPTVLVSNGDVTAQNVAVTGAGYEGSTKRWYVWLASNVSGVFRVNYTIII